MASGPEGLTVAPLGPGELTEAACIVGDAMADNPVHLAVFGPPEASNRRRQSELFAVIYRRTRPRLLVARLEGRPVGVLGMLAWPRCRLGVVDALRLALPVARILGSDLVKAARWRLAWGRHHPEEAHWHLGPVAVRPDLQRRGIGTALMGRFLDSVDADGLPAYLETDRPENVRWYGRFGFQVHHRIEVDGVPTWLMWRPAAGSGIPRPH